MRRRQSVQNAAARLITGTRRCDHISPVLRQLHWLPVRQRVNYKIATLVYWFLSGHVPADIYGGQLPTLSLTPVSDNIIAFCRHWNICQPHKFFRRQNICRFCTPNPEQSIARFKGTQLVIWTVKAFSLR